VPNRFTNKSLNNKRTSFGNESMSILVSLADEILYKISGDANSLVNEGIAWVAERNEIL